MCSITIQLQHGEHILLKAMDRETHWWLSHLGNYPLELTHGESTLLREAISLAFSHPCWKSQSGAWGFRRRGQLSSLPHVWLQGLFRSVPYLSILRGPELQRPPWEFVRFLWCQQVDARQTSCPQQTSGVPSLFLMLRIRGTLFLSPGDQQPWTLSLGRSQDALTQRPSCRVSSNIPRSVELNTRSTLQTHSEGERGQSVCVCVGGGGWNIEMKLTWARSHWRVDPRMRRVLSGFRLLCDKQPNWKETFNF